MHGVLVTATGQAVQRPLQRGHRDGAARTLVQERAYVALLHSAHIAEQHGNTVLQLLAAARYPPGIPLSLVRSGEGVPGRETPPDNAIPVLVHGRKKVLQYHRILECGGEATRFRCGRGLGPAPFLDTRLR